MSIVGVVATNADRGRVVPEPTAPASPELVGHWKLDETSGPTALDEIGNSDGTYSNPELGLDPLLADGGTSVGFSTSNVVIPHAAQFAVAEFSVVLWFQPDSLPAAGANRQLFAKDSLLPPGGLTIEHYNDGGTGRIRVAHRNATGGAGSATFVGGSSGVGTIVNDTAYRVAVTCATGVGVRVYIDDAEVASDALDTGLASNSSEIRVGQYHAGGNSFDGVLDDVRLYTGALDATEVQALPDAQSITHAPSTTALVRPGYDLATGQDANPAGAIWWDPTGGNDGNDGSTKALAKKTLGAAEGAMGAERTIVAVGGVHSVSPVTIGADNYTLEAEQGTTVVLNFNGEFAAFADAPNSLWEQSGVYWRTKTGGEFSSGRVQGLYFDGAYAWGIRHEPSDSDNNQTGNDYAGPTVRVNSDGRLYLRFDKPNVAGWTDDWPSYMPGTDGAGNWTVPSQGPNDTRLYLWRQGSGEKAITLNGRTGVHFKDLNFRGRSVMFAMDTGTCSGCTVERCTVYGCTWFVRQTGGTLNTLTVKGCKILHGRLTYYFWNNLKSLGGGGDVNPGGTWDDNACINLNSGGANDWTWEDNLVTGFFDFHVGNDAIEGFTERYNWYEDVLDDHMQTQVDFETWECAYNMFEHASFCGYAETGPSGTRATLGEQYIHNNVVWNRIPRPWIINTRPGPHATIPAHFASGASGRLQPQKFYNNTIIGQTAPKEVNRALRMSHLGGESNNDSSEPHEWYNNIIMMYGDELWNNKDGADRDDVAGGLHLDGFSNEIYDFNHYVRILAYSPASTSFFVNCYDRATRSGGPYDFTSAADLAGDAANQINAEASGTSAESVGVGISNMNTDADNPFEDLEGLDFHVKAGNPAKSGAKNLSATGWPGAGSITAGSERGAYGGGNTQIGPRASVLNY